MDEKDGIPQDIERLFEQYRAMQREIAELKRRVADLENGIYTGGNL